MPSYKIHGATDEIDDTIYATHPAQPGTQLVYAFKDGSHLIMDVLLWGVLSDGVPVPITIQGVWDGSGGRNKFVQFPGGRCADFDRSWDSFEQALTEMGQYED